MINVKCENGGWAVDVWPKSQQGFQPFLPHSGDIRFHPFQEADGYVGRYIGRVSQDVADQMHAALMGATYTYQFPFSECQQFAWWVGDMMLSMCP